MTTPSKSARRPPPSGGKPTGGEASEGRTISFAKKAGVVVGLISGVAGLFFLFFPQFRPEVSKPPADQSATITGVVVNPHTTKGQYLAYSDQSRLGFTKQQLSVIGASAFARVTVVGYRNRKLTLARQLIDARTGDVVGEAHDFVVTPPADRVTHRWWDWVPLRSGRGSYIMVIKVLDDQQRTAIACGQTRTFGGLAGVLPASPPQICEE